MDKLARAVVARFEAMKPLGEAAVDSGSLLVIDPAYVKYWGTGEHPELSYDSLKNIGSGQLHFNHGGTAAVLIGGFGGDGTYPVLVEERNNPGEQSVGSFVVDFMPEVPESATPAEKVAAKYKKKIETDKGNTVYQYSDRQVATRNKKKAERIEKLRKSIGDLRRKMKRDLKSNDPEKSMTALAVALIDHTYERVGNEGSADDGHYGVTGWKKKHVTFTSKGATIRYTGKAGVKQEKKVTDASIKQALREAYEACDKDAACLFSGEWGSVTADKVNDYLEPFDVTAKDIRGFHANREMQTRLKAMRADGDELPKDKKEKAKVLKAEFLKALDETAEAVGHEATTLRSQYLIPGLEEQYLKNGTVSDKMSSVLEVDDRTIEERVAARYLRSLV